jgi:hypothetical protein
MTAIEAGLKDLRRQHPEWEPWLAVVQEVLSETVNPEWDSLVPIPSESQQSKVPVLAGITLTLERRSILGGVSSGYSSLTAPSAACLQSAMGII